MTLFCRDTKLNLKRDVESVSGVIRRTREMIVDRGYLLIITSSLWQSHAATLRIWIQYFVCVLSSLIPWFLPFLNTTLDCGYKIEQLTEILDSVTCQMEYKNSGCVHVWWLLTRYNETFCQKRFHFCFFFFNYFVRRYSLTGILWRKKNKTEIF